MEDVGRIAHKAAESMLHAFLGATEIWSGDDDIELRRRYFVEAIYWLFWLNEGQLKGPLVLEFIDLLMNDEHLWENDKIVSDARQRACTE